MGSGWGAVAEQLESSTGDVAGGKWRVRADWIGHLVTRRRGRCWGRAACMRGAAAHAQCARRACTKQEVPRGGTYPPAASRGTIASNPAESSSTAAVRRAELAHTHSRF